MNTEETLELVLKISHEVTFDEKEINADTRLIGSKAVLDSLDLVSLISEIEQHYRKEHNLNIVLASAKAMSMKSSPFKTPHALAEYIVELVAEAKSEE